MSNANALFKQANHTLTLISQKEPTQEHLKQLHDGYLSDLMDAIMDGTLPDRETLRKTYGLPPIGGTIIRVDRSIRPSYPDWVEMVILPKLGNTVPSEYDIAQTKLWLHNGQKYGQRIVGDQIYIHLKKTRMLKTCLGLRDLEEIQKKGVAFFRKHFAGKAVFGWASVVRHRSGSLHVSYLYEDGYEVILDWIWLGNFWSSDYHALHHAR